METNKLHRFRFHVPAEKQETLLSPSAELMQLIDSLTAEEEDFIMEKYYSEIFR